LIGAKPLTGYENLVKISQKTKTEIGLKVKCRLDKNKKGNKVLDDVFDSIYFLEKLISR
jgi:hypothetical protein